MPRERACVRRDTATGLMVRLSRVAGVLSALGAVALLAGCATPPAGHTSRLAGRVWDPKLGVWSSPQIVGEGDTVPRGGGTYLTGRPYVIGGHTYVPSQNPVGYAMVGTASWYGDAFHGRRTANGEVFDKRSISAAHPTLPLPSYVRVTNLINNRSMIVRVNDRGPYHGGRVMDVSQRVAEALDFRGAGTAHVKVEYMGRAPLSGSDDNVLMASLRTDGAPARLDGVSEAPVMVADTSPEPEPVPRTPTPAPPALRPSQDDAAAPDEPTPLPARGAVIPTPPARPFSLGDEDTPSLRPERRRIRHVAGTDVAPAGRDAPAAPPRRAETLHLRRQAWLNGRADGE